ESGRSARMLVLTDGFSTEDLAGVTGQLREAGVPMDLRLVQPESGEDYHVERLLAPSRVRPGEGFLLEVQAGGTRDAAVPYEVLRNGESVGRGSVEIRGGRGSVRVSGRSVQPGAHRYEVR